MILWYSQICNSVGWEILDFCVFLSDRIDDRGLEVDAGHEKLVVDEDIRFSAGTGNTLAITDLSGCNKN